MGRKVIGVVVLGELLVSGCTGVTDGQPVDDACADCDRLDYVESECGR